MIVSVTQNDIALNWCQKHYLNNNVVERNSNAYARQFSGSYQIKKYNIETIIQMHNLSESYDYCKCYAVYNKKID